MSTPSPLIRSFLTTHQILRSGNVQRTPRFWHEPSAAIHAQRTETERTLWSTFDRLFGTGWDSVFMPHATTKKPCIRVIGPLTFQSNAGLGIDQAHPITLQLVPVMVLTPCHMQRSTCDTQSYSLTMSYGLQERSVLLPVDVNPSFEAKCDADRRLRTTRWVLWMSDLMELLNFTPDLVPPAVQLQSQAMLLADSYADQLSDEAWFNQVRYAIESNAPELMMTVFLETPYHTIDLDQYITQMPSRLPYYRYIPDPLEPELFHDFTIAFSTTLGDANDVFFALTSVQTTRTYEWPAFDRDFADQMLYGLHVCGIIA